MDSKDKKEVSFKGIIPDRIQSSSIIYKRDLWKDVEDNEDWKEECGLDQKEKTE